MDIRIKILSPTLPVMQGSVRNAYCEIDFDRLLFVASRRFGNKLNVRGSKKTHV